MDPLVAEGVVIDSCRGLHHVEVTIGTTKMIVLARRSGKLDHVHRIRCLPGDRVDVSICPYDPTRGRIVRRHR